ncbi:MAG: peroxiredoxin [Deltaproteobacteria bacterium]|nr:peroxiredoxin [Deltaproteobacteria bacterium]MCB9788839.1 peroxiredoxin [Deltaproteobacteria bacterium]
MLEAGDKAPSFDAPIDGGGTLSSASLAGKPYVIYFYPKDNTPGCTTEACDFRDRFERIAQTGGTVIGVSKDSVKSHDGFKAKHGLPFHLIADTDGALHEGYGTWGTKKNYGREYQGTFRSTFLVGADGRIAQAWPKVRVKGHVDEVLAALEALQG